MQGINSITAPVLETAGLARAQKPSKLHDAAQQFEALMIGEMMKTVREARSDGWLGSGADTGDDSAMEMAEAQFAQALAAGGGLGLSKTIEESVTAQHSELQNVTPVRAK
jgi:Rod binding domain-containing protein